MPDGSDIIQLSWHDTNEWQPSVDNNGMLVYTRWDYVDRDSDVAHHLWRCYPDGRNPRSPHGNYPEAAESRPWMELSLRAIPGSTKYVGVAAPHHGEAYGSLVLIDLQQREDGKTGQIRRITPEALFPEAESAPGVPQAGQGKHAPRGEVYGTPWPLDEDFYLSVYDPGQRNYGLYLLDSFGNRELLYRNPEVACLAPIPLRAAAPAGDTGSHRPSPSRSPRGGGSGDGRGGRDERPPEPATVAAGRADQAVARGESFPKGERRGRRAADRRRRSSRSAGACWASRRSNRTAARPVHAARRHAGLFPAPRPRGAYGADHAVGDLRASWRAAYLRRLPRVAAEVAAGGQDASVGTRRGPSRLEPEATGSYPLSFPRLVQPVLDAWCVACHDREKKAPKLHGDRLAKSGRSEAFESLRAYAWGMSGGNGTALREQPILAARQGGSPGFPALWAAGPRAPRRSIAA